MIIHCICFQIGIVKPGVPIDIVLNTETKRKTPMVVYIKGDERLFGDSAVTRVSNTADAFV